MERTMNVFLANLVDNESFTGSETLMQSEINRLFNRYENSSAGSPINEVLFIHDAYEGADLEEYLRTVSDLFEKPIISLSSDPEKDIINTRAIAIGGGNLAQLNTAINPYYRVLRDAILNGVPYIAWNEGSAIFSALYMFNDLASDRISPVGFHFFNNYDHSTESNNEISDFLSTFSYLDQIVSLPNQTQGSGIRIEDSKAGLAGTTDALPGGGGTGSELNKLYIYELDTNGHIMDRGFSDPENLPIM